MKDFNKNIFDEFKNIAKELKEVPSMSELIDFVTVFAQELVKEADKEATKKEADKQTETTTSEQNTHKNDVDKLVDELADYFETFMFSDDDTDYDDEDNIVVPEDDEDEIGDDTCCVNKECTCNNKEYCCKSSDSEANNTQTNEKCLKQQLNDNVAISDIPDACKMLAADQRTYEKKADEIKSTLKNLPTTDKSPIYMSLYNAFYDEYTKRDEYMHENVYPAILRWVEKQIILLCYKEESKASWYFGSETPAIKIDTSDLDYVLTSTDLQRIKAIFAKYLNCTHTRFIDSMIIMHF